MDARGEKSNLISAEALKARLEQPETRVVDVRFSLQDPAAGRRAYREGHLPGAIYLDLEADLSAPVREDRRGGRHPLPDLDAFAARLGAAGIGNRHHVVAYDDAGGMFAGRLWWLLRYAGHDRVQVLDGGLGAWLEAGGTLTTEAPQHAPETFRVRPRPEMVVDHAFVRGNLDNPDVLLLDARAPERYRGDTEPLDPKAGHIPGAVNLPFAGNLEGGRFKDVAALRERFADVADAGTLVAYCGSGVSAAHNLLALEEAGVKHAKLYPGSWSDWVSHGDAPVASGDAAPGRGG
jgi:thiosulfate/3-mercaptopyruvate sulfurtransferase